MSAKVLFDTSVASYWYAGNPDWVAQLQLAMTAIEKERGTIVPLVSAVSWQELAVFAGGQSDERRAVAMSWFRSKFPLPVALTNEIAERAARLQSRVDYDRSGSRGQRNASKNAWFRDAAVVATAIQQEADYLLYSDDDIDRWRNDFDGKMVKLPAPPAPVAPPT